MDNKETITNYNHGVNLVERKNLVISGVKKIDNFDKEQFLIETVMGSLLIKGEELVLVKLDTLQGNLAIKGMVKSLSYLDESQKRDKDNSIFNRLFK